MLYLYFLVKQKLFIFSEKNAHIIINQGMFYVIYMYLGSSLGKV